MFMKFEEGGGIIAIAALALGGVHLDFTELVERFLEVAGEALGVQAEGSEGAMGIDDVEINSSLVGGRVSGAVEEGGFEQRDAIEAPGSVGVPSVTGIARRAGVAAWLVVDVVGGEGKMGEGAR